MYSSLNNSWNTEQRGVGDVGHAGRDTYEPAVHVDIRSPDHFTFYTSFHNQTFKFYVRKIKLDGF